MLALARMLHPSVNAEMIRIWVLEKRSFSVPIALSSLERDNASAHTLMRPLAGDALKLWPARRQCKHAGWLTDVQQSKVSK